MQFLTPELAFNLVSMLIAAGAIYGGIRSDIRNLHNGVQEAKRIASRAHDRIDRLSE